MTMTVHAPTPGEGGNQVTGHSLSYLPYLTLGNIQVLGIDDLLRVS